MVADVTVVGTGIIGLTTAIALGDRGLHVRLVGTTHAGNASSAAGGMLAPSIHREPGPALDFALAARDGFAAFADTLAARAGRAVPLNRLGILELAFDIEGADALRSSLVAPSRWLEPREIAELEPELAPVVGGALHPDDGAVEPLPLLDALRIVVARHDRIETVVEDAVEIHVSDGGCQVLTALETRVASDRLVLAAGAWTPLITGAGATVTSVHPVRGQMIAFAAPAPVRHVVYGAGAYLIPVSDGHLVAGSTAEHAGFDARTTSNACVDIVQRASTACPALRGTRVSAQWAGLRPMTPDFHPIIGADPERSRLFYSCGHSRNGILLAALSAECVADLVIGAPSRHDLSPFRSDRPQLLDLTGYD